MLCAWVTMMRRGSGGLWTTTTHTLANVRAECCAVGTLLDGVRSSACTPVVRVRPYAERLFVGIGRGVKDIGLCVRWLGYCLS